MNFDIYYSLPCASGYVCQLSTAVPANKNWTCVIDPAPLTGQFYPGEMCTYISATSSQCSPFSTGCSGNATVPKGTCMGLATNAPCTSSAQCVAENSCQAGTTGKVCTILIETDKAGCMEDTDCLYSLGCNITSPTSVV
jgi:hypothetical protein